MKKKSGSSTRAWIITVILLSTVLLVLVITAVMIFTGKGMNSNPLARGISRTVTQKAVQEFVSSELGIDEDFEEIRKNMSPEDSRTVDGIIDKYAESGVLADAVSSLRENGGDLQGTISDLRDRIDEEDIETVMELYSRYGQTE